MPTPDEARELGLPPGVPVFRILRTVYDSEGPAARSAGLGCRRRPAPVPLRGRDEMRRRDRPAAHRGLPLPVWQVRAVRPPGRPGTRDVAVAGRQPRTSSSRTTAATGRRSRQLLPDVAARCDILLGPYSTILMRAAGRMAAEAGWLVWNHGGSGDDVEEAHPGHVVSVLTPTSRYAEPFLLRLASERRSYARPVHRSRARQLRPPGGRGGEAIAAQSRHPRGPCRR